MSHYKKNKGSLFFTYRFLSSVVRGSSRMNDYGMPEFIHLKTSLQKTGEGRLLKKGRKKEKEITNRKLNKLNLSSRALI